MKLDDVIKHIQENYQLSSEVRNALHGVLSSHPWCVGKSLEQRKFAMLLALFNSKGISSEIFSKIDRAPE
jgi:fido (protein-threonine AMPylation protein)